MDIIDFVSERLEEQQQQADNVRASLAVDPPHGASYAQGFVDYHDNFRACVAKARQLDPDDRLADLPLLNAATSFRHHPDFDAEWDFRLRQRD